MNMLYSVPPLLKRIEDSEAVIARKMGGGWGEGGGATSDTNLDTFRCGSR